MKRRRTWPPKRRAKSCVKAEPKAVKPPRPPKPPKPKVTTDPGARFGRLTAMEFHGLSANGHEQWAFECDCGVRVVRVVGTVHRAMKTLGWAACRDCYLISSCLHRILQLPHHNLPLDETERPAAPELVTLLTWLIKAKFAPLPDAHFEVDDEAAQ
jgi:hypothetical protein